MNFIKGALQSKTVWAGIVGLAASAAGHLGYTVLPADTAGIVDGITQAITPLAAIGAIIFRITATHKIVLGGAK